LTRAVAALAFFRTLAPSLFAQDTFSHPRIISVTGTAEIKVAPDEVTLTLGVDSHDKELAVAKADNDKRVKKLMSIAHAAGIDPKNIQTSALTMAQNTQMKNSETLGLSSIAGRHGDADRPFHG
jgi:uncharacterized protein